ncbi:hypothetical protein MBLNU459_g5834t2 [Dothideomycetes sp. NU459]
MTLARCLVKTQSRIADHVAAATQQKDGDDPGEAQYQKRREQVRRAQRKEHYIKSLEAELTTLRTSQTALEQRAKNAESELKYLKSSLKAGHDHHADQRADPIVNIRQSPTGTPQLQVDFNTLFPSPDVSSRDSETMAETATNYNLIASPNISSDGQTPASGYGSHASGDDQTTSLSDTFHTQLSYQDGQHHIDTSGLIN